MIVPADRLSILPTLSPDSMQARATTRVALVNMPFAMADRPSIQCGLLKSCLTRAGHDVDVFYLNLEFAAEFGAPFYREISRMRTDLLGEWMFSAAAFGYRANEREYQETCPYLPQSCERLGVDFETLCDLRREKLPAWIDHWLEAVDWSLYSAVGFTSTFEQNTAAFALARRIKEKHPKIYILFGGANFDGDMGREYVRALPFIDYAVTGEGDRALAEIVERIALGESALGLPGVLGRAEDGTLIEGGAGLRVHDMDGLPDPDYDEYFATLFRLGRGNVLETRPPLLLFESSRGCWWGEKQHCTFCGLNNNGMKYRAKSPSAAEGQLRRLAAKYKIVNFESVDNILDYRYLEQLCTPLAEKRYDYRIFYEVKANLHPSQLRTMARAGIKMIQPGIESLNSHILSLMRKGITMLRNVRLLKWAHYYGMEISWSILTGFPGETEQDYADQLRVVKLLGHLPAPQWTGPIWLERFSPYFFDKSFPVRDVKPLKVYSLIYPEGEIALDQIAYFFHYKMDDTLPEEHHDELRGAVEQWKKAWKRRPRPELIYQRAPDWIQIVDRRQEKVAAHAFHGAAAEIYEHCSETEQTLGAITKHLQEQELDADPGQIQAALQEFCERGLMLEENGRYLSLALPVNQHW